eukprot:scaffold210576_cov49-Prasinocladus_malaysianus.AAC.3
MCGSAVTRVLAYWQAGLPQDIQASLLELLRVSAHVHDTGFGLPVDLLSFSQRQAKHLHLRACIGKKLSVIHVGKDS